MNLQEEQTAIDQEIVSEIVALIPETWEHAVLEVAYSLDDRGDGFDHSIYSPDGHSESIEPTDGIYDATFRLQQLFRKYGGMWSKVKYDVSVDDDGVRYKARFDSSLLDDGAAAVT